uniref:Uncharacterized protein n=1 Tax=Romanomermis culicivorax TaxID=13658 RepID=A0A915J8S2_ROMCU
MRAGRSFTYHACSRLAFKKVIPFPPACGNLRKAGEKRESNPAHTPKSRALENGSFQLLFPRQKT